MEKTLNRRAFIAASGAVAGVAPLTTLARVGKADEPQEIAWDYEADLVVVGGGGAGFCAGIEAAEAGCTVLVVEKAGVCGGDSYMCGGAIQAAGHPLQEKFSDISGDTGEKFAEDIIRWGQGLVDEDMVRDVCVNSADQLDFMIGCGREYDAVEYLQPVWSIDEGREEFYPRCFFGESGGYYGVHFPPIEQKLLSYGDQVTILTETEATHLVRNAEGRIIGIEADDGKNTIHARANKGVVLSTAGIDHDMELAKQVHPFQYWALQMREAGLSHSFCFDNIYNTGDGIRMGLEVGADPCFGRACVITDEHNIGGTSDYNRPQSLGHEPNRWGSTCLAGNILVGPRGTRYVQEDAVWGYSSSETAKHLMACGIDLSNPNKFAYLVTDADHLWTWNGGDISQYNAANTIVQADTLEELAEKMGVPAVNLVKTVEEWNGYCDGEFDPDFGRQVDFGKIQTPPFYADIYKPFVLGTAGGLRTDTNAQVVDANGDPIPGLYAAGMIMTGTVTPPFYPGCGWAILNTVHWGRKAGQQIAALESWA